MDTTDTRNITAPVEQTATAATVAKALAAEQINGTGPTALKVRTHAPSIVAHVEQAVVVETILIMLVAVAAM